MRILYFSRDYTTHDRRFLLKLSESRHDVWFLRLEDDGIPYESRELPKGIQPVRFSNGVRNTGSPDQWLELMPQYEDIVQQIGPDLVHAGPVQSCAFMTAELAFHPLLTMSWGSDLLVDADRDENWRRISTHTLKHSDYFLCDCNAVRIKAQQLSGLPDDRIVQFPWGTDLQCYSPGEDGLNLKDQSGWEDTFIIISNRSWEPIYGIDVLMEAFKIAQSQNHRLRLILLGDGSLSSMVQDFILRSGLDGVVLRPGIIPQEQMPDYYRASELYVSCALSDGSSVGLIEAMATGLPVVAADGPGNSEWVTVGANGWLAKNGDSESFAAQMLLASNAGPAARSRISHANRALCEERADWDRNFEALFDVYDEIEAKYVR